MVWSCLSYSQAAECLIFIRLSQSANAAKALSVAMAEKAVPAAWHNFRCLN
jgi:hypothetical protein